MAEKIQKPKGTQDLLPEVTAAWQYVETTARQLFTSWGYGEIRTPIFEDTALFLRGVGETTDIVHKEMYRFEKSERDLCLRPEGTAGVVRAFMEAGLSRAPKPVKLWYTGPMFRYERPQAGRYRQFHQLGAEVFGLATPETDVEVIALAWQLLEKLGLTGLTLHLNDIGTASDRTSFRAKLQDHLRPLLPNLCKTCQHRFEENPFRMLDCKVPACQAAYESVHIDAFLKTPWTGDDSQAAFARITALLSALDIPWGQNHKLVRGLDYYTHTVFEITANTDGVDGMGTINTVCGGGRYDGLVETLGGEPTPGVGWALGLERLIALLPKNETASPLIVVLPNSNEDFSAEDWSSAYQKAETLRHENPTATVLLDTSNRAFKKQMEAADKRGATTVWLQRDGEWQHKVLDR
jgi:histidyl-tRNA synthetase